MIRPRVGDGYGDFARKHRRNLDEHKDRLLTVEEAHALYEKLKKFLWVVEAWSLERLYYRRYRRDHIRPIGANGFFILWNQKPKGPVGAKLSTSERTQRVPTFKEFCEAYKIVLLADAEIVRTK